MKIYIGADHNGFQLKAELIEYLNKLKYEVIDVGNQIYDPDDDFPQFAARLVSELLASDDLDSKGILICGSGQGVCMAANRFKGIRAGVVWDIYEARAVRNDDDSNVLCLPARSLKKNEAKRIVDTWLNTNFERAARFVRRIRQMDELG